MKDLRAHKYEKKRHGDTSEEKDSKEMMKRRTGWSTTYSVLHGFTMYVSIHKVILFLAIRTKKHV